VRKGWETKKLGDVCQVVGGGTPPKDREDFYRGNIPWATVRDMRQEIISETEFKITEQAVKSSATNIIPANNVVIATRVGLGKVCFIERDTAINQDLRGIIPIKNKELLVRFLFWWFKSVAHLIEQEGTGATVQGVKLPFIKSLSIPLPPLPEQKRIVAILDEAFEGITAAVANAEKNLANARELFEIYRNSIFTQKGEGWIDTCIGDQVMLQRGFDITKDQQKPGRVPVVSSGGVKSSHDTAMVRAPGVVIGRKGTLGKTFFLEEDFWPHDTTLWVKNFKGNDPRFVYHFFTALDVLHLDTGTANPALNRNQVHPIKIVWPPVDQQKLLADKFDALKIETQRLEGIYQQKLDALAELKQSILQKAFAGELTARPEQVLQEAVA
jgi:type I restriction enzyme S subunit